MPNEVTKTTEYLNRNITVYFYLKNCSFLWLIDIILSKKSKNLLTLRLSIITRVSRAVIIR